MSPFFSAAPIPSFASFTPAFYVFFPVVLRGFDCSYFVKLGSTDMGLPDVVGGSNAYRARPVVGGHFAVLAKVMGAGSLVM